MAGFEVSGAVYRFHWIPAGTFMMGSPETEPGHSASEVQHLVTISQGFWMGETPVTQALWTAVMRSEANPARFKDPNRPVERVSWHDAQRFLNTLNQHHPDFTMALPTEAQWEYACRAGSTEATYAGPITIVGEKNAPVLDAIAWYGGNSGLEYDLHEYGDSSSWGEKQYPHTRAGTRKVGMRRRNGWGLQDMLGNVGEWCLDYYHESYGRPLSVEKAAIDPKGPSEGSERVLRGGSWYSHAAKVRAAHRYHNIPSLRVGGVGFRLARPGS